MSHQSLFDKSQAEEGLYLLTTKSGAKYAYTKRTEVWKDKANAQHVSLDLLELGDLPLWEIVNDMNYLHNQSFGSSYKAKRVDVRYNDVSTVLEIETT